MSITGLSVLSALGRGAEAQLAAALPGAAAFGEVRRFDTTNRRVTRAATAPDARSLEEELLDAVIDACADTGLTPAQRATTPLFLAVHGRSDVRGLATRAAKIYTSACVSASTAVADAAALIRNGCAERIVVAAGYLVESDQFALFDAGRALSDDSTVRPFSRSPGILLGDGVVAVVLKGERVWPRSPAGGVPAMRTTRASRLRTARAWQRRSNPRCTRPTCHRTSSATSTPTPPARPSAMPPRRPRSGRCSRPTYRSARRSPSMVMPWRPRDCWNWY